MAEEKVEYKFSLFILSTGKFISFNGAAQAKSLNPSTA